MAASLEQQRTRCLEADLAARREQLSATDEREDLCRAITEGKSLAELVVAGGLAFLAGHADSALTTFRAALEVCESDVLGRWFLVRTIERIENPERFAGGGLVVLRLHPRR